MGYIKQCISNTFLLIKTIEKPEKAVAFYLTFAREKDTKWWISDLGITPIKHTSLFYGNTWLNIYQFNRWAWYTGTRELRIGNLDSYLPSTLTYPIHSLFIQLPSEVNIFGLIL